MENDFKKLLGESITDDTAAALQEILETHIASLKESLEIAKEDLQEAKEKLEEAQAEHDAEVKSIVEKADEYAEEVRQEVTEELTEKAEAYAEKVREEVTADLTEKAEAYGAYLIEQGEAYGAYLIERAEAYGEHLQEKAEEYGDLRESKALEKAEEMIAEFKKTQPQLFHVQSNGKEPKIPYDWTIYYLRKKALLQAISKEELAWLLLNFNQKRYRNQFI
jgi:hypothetical protein